MTILLTSLFWLVILILTIKYFRIELNCKEATIQKLTRMVHAHTIEKTN